MILQVDTKKNYFTDFNENKKISNDVNIRIKNVYIMVKIVLYSCVHLKRNILQIIVTHKKMST